MKGLNISGCIIFILLSGCIQEFEIPESPSQTRLLVVEGTIGDELSRVKLSRSANFDSVSFEFEEGARVFVENQTETVSVQLDEEGDGVYMLESSLDITDRYRMRIETGRDTYVSDYMEILETPDIDSVFWALDSGGDIEFFVTTEEGPEASPYFRWEYEETWHYRSPEISKYIYKGGELVMRTENENISNCWITEFSEEILLGSTVSLGKNLVANEFIREDNVVENIKFLHGYSLLVNQYSLTQEAYDFWSILEKNTESLGTLFDPQPSQLPTNMRCITDPSKAVLGFIGASSRAQKRVFVRPRPVDIPVELFAFVNDLPERCEIDVVQITPASLLAEFGSGEKVPLTKTEPPIGDPPPPERILSTTRECADCNLLKGGVKQKPDYWFD